MKPKLAWVLRAQCELLAAHTREWRRLSLPYALLSSRVFCCCQLSPGFPPKNPNDVHAAGRHESIAISRRGGKMVLRAQEVQCQSPLPMPALPAAFRPMDRVEEDLKAAFPRDSWAKLHLQFIYFGREHCQARNVCSSVFCTCWLPLRLRSYSFSAFAVFPLLPSSL